MQICFFSHAIWKRLFRPGRVHQPTWIVPQHSIWSTYLLLATWWIIDTLHIERETATKGKQDHFVDICKLIICIGCCLLDVLVGCSCCCCLLLFPVVSCCLMLLQVHYFTNKPPTSRAFKGGGAPYLEHCVDSAAALDFTTRCWRQLQSMPTARHMVYDVSWRGQSLTMSWKDVEVLVLKDAGINFDLRAKLWV